MTEEIQIINPWKKSLDLNKAKQVDIKEKVHRSAVDLKTLQVNRQERKIISKHILLILQSNPEF